MRKSRRLFNHASDEVGWISTADMFVIASCFLLFLLTGKNDHANDPAGRLGIAMGSGEQGDSGLTQELSWQLEAVNQEREKLINGIQSAHESVLRISNPNFLRSEVFAPGEKFTADSKLRDVQSGLDFYEIELKKLRELVSNAGQSVEEAKRQAIDQQRSLNNKLVGLGGELDNVVFLVDVSKSMQSGNSSNGVFVNNWGPIVEVIERWVNGLNVGSAALVIFGDNAEVKMNMQRLEHGGREQILKVLRNIEPNAEGTNFLAAFEQAYRIPNVDTIIVFSDGLPSIDVKGNRITVGSKKANESEGAYRRRIASEVNDNVTRVLEVHRRINEMAKKHPRVAINAIGLGAGVYNERTGNLLNDLALKNGGVFLALPSRVSFGGQD